MNDNSIDPLKRDRKKQNLSDLPSTIFIFAVYVIVLLPLWLAVLLPISLFTFVLEKIYIALTSTKKAKRDSFVTFDKVNVPPAADRELDLVVFGATGFTGNLNIS